MYSNHTSPFSSSSSPLPRLLRRTFSPAGRSYSLWNFTLTSCNPRSAGNTKATFQSASTTLRKIIVCLVISPPLHPGDKLQRWKEQQFAAGAPAPWRPYDPILQYQTLRRWGKPVSSASLSGYHPPTGRQRHHEGSLGFNVVWGLTILTKYKSNLGQSDNRDTGTIRCNWIWIPLEEDSCREKSRFDASNCIFLFMSDTSYI